MSKKLTLAGLLALAAIAACGLSASGAQAAEFHCTSTTANCIVIGESLKETAFTVSSGKIRCKVAKVEGTASKTTNSLTATAAFSGCIWVVTFIPATVNMNKCMFRFTFTGATAVSTKIEGCEGTNVTISNITTNCVVTLGQQEGITGVAVTNTEGTEPTDVDQEVNITGTGSSALFYTETGSNCSSPGQHSDGKFTGLNTLRAYEDFGGEQGPQVGLHVF